MVDGGRLARRLEDVPDITLTLIGKPRCHLCDDARGIMNDVVRHLTGTDGSSDTDGSSGTDHLAGSDVPTGDSGDTGDAGTTGDLDSPGASRLIVRELSIEDDRALFDEYWEQIPVLLINGKVHNFWRIDPVRLTNSLKELL